MMKKLFALLLAAVMLLGAGATALAAEPEGAGYVISIANSSTTNSLTVDLLTWEGMKNGRLELTYPEELTLVSARSTLDAEAGITDLDASKPGTVHFAWAAYAAQKDRGGTHHPQRRQLPNGTDCQPRERACQPCQCPQWRIHRTFTGW